MNDLNVTISARGTKVDFDYFKEDEIYLAHYGIRINGIPKPKYELIIEEYKGNNPNGKTELIFFFDNKRLKYWYSEFLTLDIALEIYQLIIENENKSSEDFPIGFKSVSSKNQLDKLFNNKK
jgi:hypothetical protein